MIGGASSILALPPGGAPGAVPSSPATGDGDAAGFGAVFGALGATLVAIGDAAARGGAVAEGDAPATPETAAAPDVDGIIDVMSPVLDGGTRQPAPDASAPLPVDEPGQPMPKVGLPIAEDGAPSSPSSGTPMMPVASKAPVETDDSGDVLMAAGDGAARARVIEHTPKMPRVARAGHPVASETSVADDARPESSPDSPAPKEKAERADAAPALVAAAATPVAVPVVAAVPIPDVATPAAFPENDAAEGRNAMPAAATPKPLSSPAILRNSEAAGARDPIVAPVTPDPTPKPVADDAAEQDAALTAKPQLAGFILAGNDPASEPAPSAMGVDIAVEAPAAPVTSPAPSFDPRVAVARGNGIAAMVLTAPTADSLSAMPARDAQPSLTSVDGGGTVESITTPAAVAAPQPPAPLQIAPTPAPVVTAAAVPLPATDMAQVVMGHHLDLARDSAWLDQLARDIVSTAASDSQLRFKLNPEHLGSLHVELLRRDDGAAVRMTTESEAARSLLADAQGRLVAEARAHGMRITETSVDLSRNGGESGQRGWGEAQSGQSGQPNPQPRPRHVNASVTMSAVNGDRTEARAARRDLYA